MRTFLTLSAALTVLSACSSSSSSEPTRSEGLDCTVEGYPCSFADSNQASFEAALAALDGAWAVRRGGTMADVLAWLREQPAVVEAFGDDRAIRFRIEGSVPIWFTDPSEVSGAAMEAPAAGAAFGPKAVVGEDSDDSGVVDNRDVKRGVVLAPFTWLYESSDQSESLADELEIVRGYANNVDYAGNRQEADQDVTLDHYLGWGDYDFAYVAAPSWRVVGASENQTWITLQSGIQYDMLTVPDVDAAGVVLLATYDGAGTRRYAQFGLAADFFRAAYPDKLDNAMLVLPVSEVNDELTGALGGEECVLFGWTDRVEPEDGFAAMSPLFKSLRQGLKAQDALNDVDEELRTVTNTDSETVSLTRLAPGGGDQRLFELPLIIDSQGEPLEDGVNLQPLIIGNVRDGNPDSLSLLLSVDGVTESDREEFVVRYKFDGNDLPGEYDLADAIQDAPYRWRVNHDVALGFDVETGGSIPLEAIVSLPEGGTSRFVVDVNVPSTGGDEGFDECSDYIPVPVANGVGGPWEDQSSVGSAAFSASGDPGGGYFRVTATCEEPVTVRLVVRVPGDTGALFSESNLGTASPQSITAAFEVPPGGGYIAEARQADATSAEDYPIGWNLSWTLNSVVDCYEPNQRSVYAKRLPLNIDNVTAFMLGGYRSNGLEARDFDDWYKLVVNEPSRIEVTLAQSPDDIRMRLRLWGLRNVQLASAGAGAPGELFVLTYEAQPGTYFLSAEAAAIGDGAVNPIFDELPDHFATPYRMNIRTQPL